MGTAAAASRYRRGRNARSPRRPWRTMGRTDRSRFRTMGRNAQSPRWWSRRWGTCAYNDLGRWTLDPISEAAGGTCRSRAWRGGLGRWQGLGGRPLDDRAVDGIAGAVAGAVPSPVGLVPVHGASHVGAPR